MDVVQQEFNDMMSGKIPKFPKIESIYPKIQIDEYIYKHVFAEGNVIPVDYTYRVATIYNGIDFFVTYTLEHYEMFKKDLIIKHLFNEIEVNIKKYEKSRLD